MQSMARCMARLCLCSRMVHGLLVLVQVSQTGRPQHCSIYGCMHTSAVSNVGVWSWRSERTISTINSYMSSITISEPYTFQIWPLFLTLKRRRVTCYCDVFVFICLVIASKILLGFLVKPFCDQEPRTGWTIISKAPASISDAVKQLYFASFGRNSSRNHNIFNEIFIVGNRFAPDFKTCMLACTSRLSMLTSVFKGTTTTYNVLQSHPTRCVQLQALSQSL